MNALQKFFSDDVDNSQVVHISIELTNKKCVGKCKGGEEEEGFSRKSEIPTQLGLIVTSCACK